MQNQNNRPALLVAVNISQWIGRKTDKRANRSVQDAFNIQSGNGNYTKKLLPDSKELRAISSIAGAIREFTNRETLPWMADGTRILSSQNYMEFCRVFNGKKLQFEKVVSEFLLVYPAQKTLAESKLGGLYCASDYPDLDKLAKSFQCDATFLPMPEVSDFRIDLSDLEKQKFEKRMLETRDKAMLDCWSRLHEVVKTAAEKLSDPEAKFQDSLINNILETCKLLTKLNFTGDAALEAERVKIEQLANGISPDLLRVNSTDRNSAATQLAELTAKMAGIMGGN